MKSNIFLKLLLVILLISHLFCTEGKNKNQPAATHSVEKIDTSRSENFATAQVALNVQTHKDNTLAYANLDIYTPLTDSGVYKVKTLLIDDGENGPFSNFSITDKAIISKNNEIKVWISFELQSPRIVWETEQGKLTGYYGQPSFQQSVKSEGGSLSGTATLVFDEKSMSLKSQNTVINPNVSADFDKKDSEFMKWDKFVAKYLKIQLATNISWVNQSCLAAQKPCTTGVIWENKTILY